MKRFSVSMALERKGDTRQTLDPAVARTTRWEVWENKNVGLLHRSWESSWISRLLLIFDHSAFDLPKADKCLLASGELDVRCLFFSNSLAS